mgnify:CR=1 FL=1
MRQRGFQGRLIVKDDPGSVVYCTEIRVLIGKQHECGSQFPTEHIHRQRVQPSADRAEPLKVDMLIHAFSLIEYVYEQENVNQKRILLAGL